MVGGWRVDSSLKEKKGDLVCWRRTKNCSLQYFGWLEEWRMELCNVGGLCRERFGGFKNYINATKGWVEGVEFEEMCQQLLTTIGLWLADQNVLTPISPADNAATFYSEQPCWSAEKYSLKLCRSQKSFCCSELEIFMSLYIYIGIFTGHISPSNF